ncbi:cupin domain-containing protein [Actinoplanes sp. CA-142083]|uniref:cupin domain-containing protein n=1 Tax=Actinoplanes sp. CA-142083 TaxID=3239903 RepID=UPI003D93116A
MEILDLHAVPAVPIPAHGSTGFTAAHVLRGETAAVTVLRVAAGGEIGTHPAVGDQLLIVLSGEGEVRAAGGPWFPVGPGQAALWKSGEPHTTRATSDLTAVAVESDHLITGA